MERPRGIGAALRLDAEVLIVRKWRTVVAHLGAEIFTMTERRLIAFHLDAEVLIMAERQLPIWPRL